MVKQKKRTCITQSGKFCAIQGVRLIWKQKIWSAICKFLWSLTNQNAWFFSSFCTELTLFCTVFEKNCTALNQSKWRIFFMYIISAIITIVATINCGFEWGPQSPLHVKINCEPENIKWLLKREKYDKTRHGFSCFHVKYRPPQDKTLTPIPLTGCTHKPKTYNPFRACYPSLFKVWNAWWRSANAW